MSDAITVDAVIPAFDSAHFLADAVSSALSQTYPLSSIIVVDDGSTDRPEEVLSQFGSKVSLIRHKNNQGLSAARNTGIAASKADLIAFLDADDAWLPSKIERQIREFGSQPNLGLCYCSETRCNESLEPIYGHRCFRARSDEWVFDELFLEAFPIPPSTAVVARTAFENCGVFDPEMKKAQDLECWLRIAMHYAFSCVPEPLCQRRIHGVSISSAAGFEQTLHYDRRCFELCDLSAAAAGVPLPLSVPDRIARSRRRRLREFLREGNTAGARYTLRIMASEGSLRMSTRIVYGLGRVNLALRAVIRLLIPNT